MPFRSEKQRRFMWAKHPEIARRWTDEYGSKIVPSHKRKRHKRPSALQRSLSHGKRGH